MWSYWSMDWSLMIRSGCNVLTPARSAQWALDHLQRLAGPASIPAKSRAAAEPLLARWAASDWADCGLEWPEVPRALATFPGPLLF